MIPDLNCCDLNLFAFSVVLICFAFWVSGCSLILIGPNVCWLGGLLAWLFGLQACGFGLGWLTCFAWVVWVL